MNKPSNEILLKLIRDMASIEHQPDDMINMSLTELAIDSLDLVEIAVEIEDRYGLEFDADKITADSTIANIIDLLKPMNDSTGV